MSKGSEILSRIIGAGSMFASMIFFGQMGNTHEYLLPGIFFGASGLWMVIRRGERRSALPEPEVQYRLAQLQEGLASNQQELAAIQEQVNRLTEERDFLRQLATPPRVRTPAEAARPADVPAPPRAAQLPGGPPDSVPPA